MDCTFSEAKLALSRPTRHEDGGRKSDRGSCERRKSSETALFLARAALQVVVIKLGFAPDTRGTKKKGGGPLSFWAWEKKNGRRMGKENGARLTGSRNRTRGDS